MIQTPALNLQKAAKLYLLIGKYLPETQEMELLDFVKKILDNIISSGNTGDYLQATALMTGFTETDLASNYSPEEVLEIFTESLVTNKIIGMKEFFEKLGLQHG